MQDIAGVSKMEEAFPNLGVVIYGLGSIGCEIARLVLRREGLEIRGAIDTDEEKTGRDIGEVVGGSGIGVEVSDEPEDVFFRSKARVVLHSTTSKLVQIRPQIRGAIEAGMNIISTSEELSFPYIRHTEMSEEIDGLAKEHGVTVLGTGVNPGFVMDTLPITLTGVCQEVSKIVVERSIDASQRRPSFQRKIGAGLSIDEFTEMLSQGSIGHMGLSESIAMIANSLGLHLDDIRESVEPKVSGESLKNEFVRVETGTVLGVVQRGFGVKDGESVIELEFQAYLGNENPIDYIRVEGNPGIKLTIEGGIQGDLATAAMVVNMIPKVIDADPGLVTMKDLPLPSSILCDVRKLSAPK